MEIEQGKLVKFKLSDEIEGLGKICGICHSGAPVVGRGIIVEVLSYKGYTKKDYPYSHIPVFEYQLEEYKV